MIKRLLDLLVAALLLVLLAPLFVVIAASIKATSRGGVFFRQERVGRAGKPFHMFKFRSMVQDAPSIGPLLTIGDDPRITTVGRFLRRVKLDELPQLFNVLIGDMSVVGPRPEVARYVALYPSAVRDRVLSVRPGITDHAAIAFANEAEILAASADPEWTYVHEILPRKLEIYDEYVATQCLGTDLRIVGSTVVRLTGWSRRGGRGTRSASAGVTVL